MRKSTYKIVKLLSFLLIGLAFTNCSDDNESDMSPVPAANFEATPTTVEKNSYVAFTDLSTNEPTLWTWQFPGGSPTYSNDANPTVLYEGAGVYDVTLTVRNAAGGDEITKQGYIEITAPQVIDIDIVPQVRLNFEDNLDNDGAVGTAALAEGGIVYSIRPGGGDAAEFNGNNYLSIPGYTGINGAGARTVAMWTKTTTAAIQTFAHWGASGTLSRASFKMQSSGVIRFEYQGGGHNGIVPVNDGEWHHIAYTYDGNTIKLYVDGVEDFSVSDIVINTSIAGETDVYIGSQAGSAKYIGSLDDVRVFDVALTPEEVLILSNIK